MIDEKKLIDEIQDHIEKERSKCNQMVDLDLSDLVVKYNHGEYCYVNALHLVQTQPKVGEWIPVKDRLPEAEGQYLTCDKQGNIHVFYHYEHMKYPFGIGENHSQYYPPIAWMELPAPYNADMRKKVE